MKKVNFYNIPLMGRLSKKDVFFKDPLLKQLIERLRSNLEQGRKLKGLTQQQLASKSRLSVNTVSEIEQERVEDIRLSTITALTRGLGEKDPLWLFKKSSKK